MKTILYLITLTTSILFFSCNTVLGTNTDRNNSETELLTSLAVISQSTGVVSSISFNAVSGSENVSCTGTISGTIAGTTGSTLKDLRFYVHDIKLITADNSRVDFTITTDGKWQLAGGSNSFGSYPGIALLDFEDGTNSCAGGTSDTNKTITGSAPAGNYVGVEFKVGVPFYLNHLEVATASAPLNITGMYWAWNSGYKFAKIEFTNSSTNRLFHLGSGTCSGNTAGPVNTCTYPNRPTIALTKTSGTFNANTDIITLDLNALYNGADGTGTGINNCMAGNTNVNCQPIITNIGVTPSTGASASVQSAFSIR